jgi:carbon monoxide dehydrogenase subunit G
VTATERKFAMPVVEESVVIPRPIEEVFDFLADAGNLPVWDSTIIECTQLGSDPVGVGTRYRGASSIMGRRFDWTTEIIRFEHPIASASRSVEGALTFTVSNQLTVVPEGTRLTHRIEAESGLGGSFGRLLEPIVEKAQAKSVRESLATLAALLREQAVA